MCDFGSCQESNQSVLTKLDVVSSEEGLISSKCISSWDSSASSATNCTRLDDCPMPDRLELALGFLLDRAWVDANGFALEGAALAHGLDDCCCCFNFFDLGLQSPSDSSSEEDESRSVIGLVGLVALEGAALAHGLDDCCFVILVMPNSKRVAAFFFDCEESSTFDLAMVFDCEECSVFNDTEWIANTVMSHSSW